MVDGTIWYPDSQFTVHPLALVSLAECDRCGFAFDAVHDDGVDGQYTCPICVPVMERRCLLSEAGIGQ